MTGDNYDELLESRHRTNTCGGIKNDCCICFESVLIKLLTKSINKVFDESNGQNVE